MVEVRRDEWPLLQMAKINFCRVDSGICAHMGVEVGLTPQLRGVGGPCAVVCGGAVRWAWEQVEAGRCGGLRGSCFNC